MAITEFKKFLILFPDSNKADYAWFRIGLANLQGENSAGCNGLFRPAAEISESGYSLQAGYLEGISYWKMKDYNRTRMALAGDHRSHPRFGIRPLHLPWPVGGPR